MSEIKCVDLKIKMYPNRKILLLTDRIEHIENLEYLLKDEGINYISIHGSQKKKEKMNIDELHEKIKDFLSLFASKIFRWAFLGKWE